MTRSYGADGRLGTYPVESAGPAQAWHSPDPAPSQPVDSATGTKPPAGPGP
jgi:hypothetical protein